MAEIVINAAIKYKINFVNKYRVWNNVIGF